MQDENWTDLRAFLALHRAGTLAAAGSAMRVSETTVARRIKRLEQSLGLTLFARTPSGTFAVADPAQPLIAHAERMEAEQDALRETLGLAAGILQDTVRISAVPFVINRVLIPALPELHADHPALQVELTPEARNIDLSQREADIALRLSRPARGGLNVTARKLGTLPFAVYRPAAAQSSLPWIGYDDQHASLPQARWMAEQTGQIAPMRVGDVETALAAVAAGLGQSALPCVAARGAPALIEDTAQACPVTRDIWQLSHVGQNHRAAIRAAKAWLSALCWA